MWEELHASSQGNVKVRQYPMSYPFNNSVVTQLCQGACYSLADRASKGRILTLVRAGNNDLNKQKHSSLSTMHFLVITHAAEAYGSYNSRVLWVTTLFVQQCPMHGLLTINE